MLNLDIIILLLKAGAQHDSPDNAGNAPAQIVLDRGFDDIKGLIEAYTCHPKDESDSDDDADLGLDHNYLVADQYSIDEEVENDDLNVESFMYMGHNRYGTLTAYT